MNHQFMVQEFIDGGVIRLTVNRVEVKQDGEYQDGITWDELQFIKQACGYGDRQAVEIYPPDADVVYVSNMRHLWILNEPLNVGWSRG